MKVFLSLLFLLTFILTASNYAQVTINVPGDYSTIQEAIDAANNGDIVLVAEDTYYENINFKGKAITVASHFLIDGNETHIENTIIDGSQPSHPDSGSVVYFISGEDTNSVICGFTITGGIGTYTAQFDDVAGGGIYLWPSGGKILNNIIEYNSVIYQDNLALGGGIFGDLDSISIIVENNIIRNNTINGFSTSGGGIALFECGYVRIANNKIINNTVIGSYAWGGGIDCNGPTNGIYISNNYIKGNECYSNNYGGGGISLYNCIAIVKNNLIVENFAYNGAGILLELVPNTSSPIGKNNSGRISLHNYGMNTNQYITMLTLSETLLGNNTIINNHAAYAGGGIRSIGYNPEIKNSIIWGNTGLFGPQLLGNIVVEFSDVQGGYTGTGNIDSNPLFVGNFDFCFLADSSPCIDNGNPDTQYNDIEYPIGSGDPLYPAKGTLRNDMGICGGPNSTWCYRPWPLPVELTSFTATTEYGRVLLNWSTATEINNLGFEIERKIINNENQGEWVRIAFKEGFGTTTEPKEYSYIDEISSIAASSLSYRLKQIDFLGSYEYSDEVLVVNPVPIDFALHQNYPNPFNPATTISYSLPVKSQVELAIYNTLGESVIQLVHKEKEAGSYEVEFDGMELPSGIYFYRLQADAFVETKKMVLLR